VNNLVADATCWHFTGKGKIGAHPKSPMAFPPKQPQTMSPS
jgi:hypothetical protein